MKKLTLLILILLKIQSLNAQITFQKAYGGANYDGSFSIQQTSDGGYISVGVIENLGAGIHDVYLVKTNSTGDSIWTRTFGGAGTEYGYSVQQTVDGGYIVAGYTLSFGAGSADVYLIKTDSNGNSLWTKTFGNINYEAAWCVKQTIDGGFIITGNGFTWGNIFLLKTDSTGNLLWIKTFGGTISGICYSVQQTSDGGYILGGVQTSGGTYALLIKIDSLGNSIWTKTYGGAGYYHGRSAQQTTDGGYIISGYFDGLVPGNYNAFLIKTDVNGDTLWTKTYGGTGDDKGYSVLQTNEGGYIVAGSTKKIGTGTYDDAYLIKTDASGDTLWTKTYGGADWDYAYSIQQTNDNGYIISGSFWSFGAGAYDAYLIKTDSLGNAGCNQKSTLTFIGTTAVVATIVAPVVTSPTISVSSSSTVVGNGGIVTTLCTSVGIDEISVTDIFSIFPNPSAGKIIVTFEQLNFNGNVKVLNILGEELITESISDESKKEINLNNFANGIYFVKVFNGEKSYCKKLIVEHN